MASGLDGGKTLLVTSKHAVVVPHAQMGRQWMEQHLSKAGKTSIEFATFLHERNATAVFELCDDAFEEHILEYPERARGLYLHGINRNSVELDTWASTEVAKVAEYFGFKVVQRFEFNSAPEGRELADSVRKDEMLEGRIIEGFVMRCKLNGTDEPYMFKIKYDIPYLMFREWRVVTNCILSNKPFRTSYPLTKNYAAWVKQQIRTNPADFASFRNQKGHFDVRKRFFEFYKQHGASEEEFYNQISQISGAHQVFNPNNLPEFHHIMNGYIRAFAPLDLESESDKLINDVIELDSLADSAANLQVAVEALCKMFPDTLQLPSESEVNEALEYALAFKPEIQEVDSKVETK
ncbi:trna ligase [Coemansia sp. RSA 560]|nr:trna ligase [Coemansia sp. RSA 560]